MKKIILLFSVLLFLVSCENNVYDQTNIKVINLQVNSNQWVENTDADGLNRYYAASFTMPEITSDVYDLGSVNAYITFDNAQQLLPYVRHFENKEGIMWTRTVDYEFMPGKLNLYVTNSDFFQDQPDVMNFRVVLIW